MSLGISSSSVGATSFSGKQPVASKKVELPVELPAAGEAGRKFSMSMSLLMHFLVVVLAGWLDRQQQAVIDYLKTGNEILKSQIKIRRLRLTDEERRRLAVKGRALGRKLLS